MLGLPEFDLRDQINDKIKEDNFSGGMIENFFFFFSGERVLTVEQYRRILCPVWKRIPSGVRERPRWLLRDVYVDGNELDKFKFPVLRLSFIPGTKRLSISGRR